MPFLEPRPGLELTESDIPPRIPLARVWDEWGMEEYGGVQVSLPLGFGWNGECERIGADGGDGCICVVGADMWACATSYKPHGVDVALARTKQPSNPLREVI